MTECPDDKDRYRAPALEKGLDILELLAASSVGLTQGEIARHLARTSSEIFRMLFILRQRGYVAQGEDDRYFLTQRLFELAHRHPPLRRLTAVAGPAMQDLANRINQSVHMCILQAGRLMVVAQVDGPDDFVTTVRLGAQFPVFGSASGRAIAAFYPEDDLQALLAQLNHEPAENRAEFLADIPKVRQIGCFAGVSRSISGVIDLSAPIHDLSGRVVAAMTTPFIQRYRATGCSVDEARDILIETCRALSRRLGAGVAFQA